MNLNYLHEHFFSARLFSVRLAFHIVVLFVLPATTISHAQKKIIKKWDVFELTFTAKNKYVNPYEDVSVQPNSGLLKVDFIGVNGDAKGKQITVYGFWDGGQNWKARFAPMETGTWQYKSSSEDKGLNNVRGKIEVSPWTKEEIKSNPTRNGLVQVMKSGEHAGHFFQYADGTPFLWIGDTWWNWTKREIKFETYKQLVDDRAAKGFTVGQLFVPANGWGHSSSILDETYSKLDLDHMRHVEEMIKYANSKGITVWVHGWWARKELPSTAGKEKIMRWWRYLIDRLGAYNVIWVVAGEYNMYNYAGMGLDFWKELGKFIDESDPYQRIIGIHNTPPGWDGGADAPQWSTAEVLHEEIWLDYNQSQVGHGRWHNEMIPQVVSESYAKTPPKPIVITEPWYEFVAGNPTSQDIRLGAWGAMMSGAAGHTYGGGHVWLAHVPESPAGGGPWPLEKSFDNNTLDYPGAMSMSHLSKFFNTISWWTLSPHPELIHEYPYKFCLAKPGNEFVVYLRWGGGVKVDLRPSNEGDTFEYFWFNPGTGKSHAVKTVEGGEIRYFASPESYPAVTEFNDWVLRISKKQP